MASRVALRCWDGVLDRAKTRGSMLALSSMPVLLECLACVITMVGEMFAYQESAQQAGPIMTDIRGQHDVFPVNPMDTK